MLIAIWSPGLVAPAGIKMPAVEMSYRKLGSSDLLVSSCCLGTMTWGNQNTDEEAAAQLNLAWDMGVNFLDTAEIYPVPVSEATQGATDRAIGKWLKHRARDEVIIASKVAGYNARHASRASKSTLRWTRRSSASASSISICCRSTGPIGTCPCSVQWHTIAARSVLAP